MAAVNSTELTRRLIDEGARMLAEQGMAGLSLRKLASAVGASTMAVYTRFGDKERLLAAMHREGFRRLGERLQAAAAESPAALAEVGRAYRLSALENPHLYGLMFGPSLPGFEPTSDDDAAADATYVPLVGGVQAAVDHGILAGDPERIALHLWVVAHGMVSLELSGQLPIPHDGVAAAYDEALQLAAAPFVVSP